jgi:hypothetical protein
MPWGGDDPLSDVCDRALEELEAVGILLIVRDDTAKTEHYSIATPSRGLLRVMPDIVRALAQTVESDQKAVLEAGGKFVMPVSKYDEYGAKVGAKVGVELGATGIVLMVFRGKLGTGGCIGGLWRGDILINTLRTTADSIQRDLEAS